MTWLQRPPSLSWIARGMGRSYGDASLNRDQGVMLLDRLGARIDFDPAEGTATCDASVTIGDLMAHLVPLGWLPPVVPGTKFVSLGGAVAADIHGKNHHVAGSIGQHIVELELITPIGRFVCGPEQPQSDVFWATVGGMGLTGIIRRVTLRLQKLETAYVCVDYESAGDLEETLDRLDMTRDAYQDSIVWVDCLARGRRLGRSILMQGNPASLEELPPECRDDPRPSSRRRSITVPRIIPTSVFNRYSVAAVNRLYYAVHRRPRRRLVPIDRFFFPLDNLAAWNRLYGRRGFIQYQAVFPSETSSRAMVRLLECAQRRGFGSFFAGLKIAGATNAGLLSFLHQGHTIALDLPCRKGIGGLVAALDQITVEHGGRIYLAKDAMSAPETFAAGYPRLGEFREVQARIDPQGVLRSDLSRRLRILPDA